jgi:pyrroloquinoline quinone biosynthesis protein B
MEITFLGTASIGGVPEWDCACPNCVNARADPRLRRARSSIAVTLGGGRHVLVDAGHDLKQQLEAHLAPTPEEAGETGRMSRLDAVFLTHGHADHTVGVAEFCTGKSFQIPVYAPPDLIDFLFGSEERPAYFGELGRLARNYVVPHRLREDEEVTVLGGLKVRGFEVPHTKVLDDGRKYPSSTYAYEFSSGGRRFIYAPDLGSITEKLREQLDGADLFIVDACFWWDDELTRISGIPVTSYQLGHVPLEECVRLLSDVDVGQVVYTHFNHTNPVLDENKPYRKMVEDAGQELASDGLKIRL